MTGHLGQPVVGQRRDAEGVAHRNAALGREPRSGQDAHRGQVALASLHGLQRVGAVRRHQQHERAAVAFDEAQRLLRVPARHEHAGPAQQQHREVSEDECADEAELAHHERHVVAAELPAPSDPLGRVAQRVARVHYALRGRGRARGVQHHRDVVRGARRSLRRRLLGEELGQHLLADRQHEVHLSGHARGLLELRLATERNHASGLHLGAQRRQLRDAEHRRQRRDDQPTVQAPEQRDDRGHGVPADQDHGVAGLGAQGSQAAGQGGRGAAQLVVGDLAVGEDERHLVGRLVGPRGELLPEVTLAPVTICVVAVRLRLEAECGHRPYLSSRPFSLIRASN